MDLPDPRPPMAIRNLLWDSNSGWKSSGISIFTLERLVQVVQVKKSADTTNDPDARYQQDHGLQPVIREPVVQSTATV